MASDGTPEPAALRCGAAVARLRTLRNLSRAQLLARLYDQIDPADPTSERISVSWLARLENGRIVKVARPTIEALCRALGCTPRQRAWLLLQADRNVLSSTHDAPIATAEILTYAIEQLQREVPEILATLLGSRQACALDDLEILQLAATALNIAIARHHGRQMAQPHTHGNDTLRASAQHI
jgi:transcriptional regulator with XRE-family HTH domain